MSVNRAELGMAEGHIQYLLDSFASGDITPETGRANLDKIKLARNRYAFLLEQNGGVTYNPSMMPTPVGSMDAIITSLSQAA